MTKTPRLLMVIGLLVAVILGVSAIVTLALPHDLVETTTCMAAPVLGIVIDRDLQVLDVEADSGAAKAGIKRGDVLTAHAGKTVITVADFVQEFHSSDLSQPRAITIRRDGKGMSLTVTPRAIQGARGAQTQTPVPPDQQYL